MIMSICSTPAVLEVMRLVNIVILIIQIVVPIILIITGMLTFASCVKGGNDDELSKAKKSIINKVVAALLVFLVPFFVKFVAKIAFNDTDYENCLSANTEIVNNAYINQLKNLISKASDTNIGKNNRYNFYYEAMDTLYKIDEEYRGEYDKQLRDIKNEIDDLKE